MAMPRMVRREYWRIASLRVHNANTLAIAALLEQALCPSAKSMWREVGGRRGDKQPPAIGKFCKRASGLKKPLAFQRATSSTDY
jgi:hypothetical protein